MKLTVDNIFLRPDQDENEIGKIIQNRYHLRDIPDFKIVRKSLDARKKHSIVYRYRIVIDVSSELAEDLVHQEDIAAFHEIRNPTAMHDCRDFRAVVVGDGPAGLFCSLRLIEFGATVDIIERGKKIDERIRDITLLEERGILDEESNVLFGEGGAGTYSDGKLTTRINRPEVAWVLHKFMEFGAPESIAYESRPHLGSDRIRKIIENMRKFILSSGSRMHFNEKMTDLICSGNSISGIITSAGIEYRSPCIILATGHSARDVYEILDRNSVHLDRKGFAVGIRVEHPADYINNRQYGSSIFKPHLPAAEYILTYNNPVTKRGVYSFCMCPGGCVINSSSENGLLCTNGMSFSARNSPFSNAAIVVTVSPDDIGNGNLDGIQFQRSIERKAFKAGGGLYIAPAQTIPSFIAGRMDESLPAASYRPGTIPSDFNMIMPEWISEELKTAFHMFNKNLRGFISGSGVCIGTETRTSSPVRITRNDQYESLSHKGLYPIGEGAGYAGGIISSAVDGVKAADSIALHWKNR